MKELDAVTSAKLAADDKAAATEHAHNASLTASGSWHEWWTPTNAMTVSSLVLVFGAIVMLLVFATLRRGIDTFGVLKIYGTLTIIVMVVFLIVVGYDDHQIAPAVGLLGTIAGYLLGKGKTQSRKGAKISGSPDSGRSTP